MAAHETRLLILGAVALFEPVNGYQLRRELMSWQVEDWAHIKPGSIYSALGTLASYGQLERHDVLDAGRTVAVYTTTDAGRVEMDRLFAAAIGTLDQLHPLAFHTALALMPLVGRERFAELMRVRIGALEVACAAAPTATAQIEENSPPHIADLAALWAGQGRTELEWCQELLAKIESGGLYFGGEDNSWRPADDDPGWQMAADRERYLKLLGRA